MQLISFQNCLLFFIYMSLVIVHKRVYLDRIGYALFEEDDLEMKN